MNEQHKIRLDAVNDDDVLLDVRDDAQWALGHAPHAIHIPIAELEDRLGELPQTDGPLTVTCGGGSKAGRAVELLKDNGVDAVELCGGMRGWQAAGRVTVSEDGHGAGEARMGTW